MSTEINVAHATYLDDPWIFLDCPGSVELAWEAQCGMLAADVAVVVCEPETERANAFHDLQGKNVVVAGYTDNVRVAGKGAFKDNWDLSTARAVSVVRYLQSKGVEPKMLGAAGFSEYRPLAANDSAEGRSQNRRIEIALTAADYTPPVVDMPQAQQPPAPQPAAEPGR